MRPRDGSFTCYCCCLQLFIPTKPNSAEPNGNGNRNQLQVHSYIFYPPTALNVSVSAPTHTREDTIGQSIGNTFSILLSPKSQSRAHKKDRDTPALFWRHPVADAQILLYARILAKQQYRTSICPGKVVINSTFCKICRQLFRTKQAFLSAPGKCRCCSTPRSFTTNREIVSHDRPGQLRWYPRASHDGNLDCAITARRR